MQDPNSQAFSQTGSDELAAEANSFTHARQAQVKLTSEFVAAHAEAPAQAPSGGDFYKAFPFPEGSNDIGVVMGDVAGHGPQHTVQAEHMRELLADCLALGMSPAETLSAVNAMLEPDPHYDGFSTVFVGKLEAETGALTYASGGHEPALIGTPDPETTGRIEELEGTGPPVGAFPPEIAHFEEHKTTLPAGATLLLYTDGVSDAHPPHDRTNWLGIERLKRILASLVYRSPRQLVNTLLKHVSEYCRGRLGDDVAIVAIRRRLPRSPKTRQLKR